MLYVHVIDDFVAIGHAYDWWRKCKDRGQWKTMIQVLYLVLRTGKHVIVMIPYSHLFLFG